MHPGYAGETFVAPGDSPGGSLEASRGVERWPLSCLGCTLFYSIVYCVHPMEWSGGHYSAYPVEWHGGHYSVLGCILFYYIVYCVHPVEWSGGHSSVLG